MSYPKLWAGEEQSALMPRDTVRLRRLDDAAAVWEVWRDSEPLVLEPSPGKRVPCLPATGMQSADLRAVAFFLARLGGLDGELREVDIDGANVAFELVR